MKSDIITIDNRCNGFEAAISETKKVADYTGLSEKDSLCLQLLAEEVLSLAHSVTGEMEASFWIENEGKQFQLHMTTHTVMDKEKRHQLLSTATSRKNEAAKSFLGMLRDLFEEAMLAEADNATAIPDEILADLANRPIEDTEWDGYERSVLRRKADGIKVGIRGNLVDMTVSKRFE